jgi:predicted TIM-barrel fold metal-dependent hydrolase
LHSVRQHRQVSEAPGSRLTLGIHKARCRNFKFRCQFFARRKPADAELLIEIYELRCAVEHLNPMGDKLSAYPSGVRDNKKRVRAYQAELLASFVYRKILTNPALVLIEPEWN